MTLHALHPDSSRDPRPDPVAAARGAAEPIAGRAAAADRGETDLAPDLAALHEAGLLTAALPTDQGGAGLWNPRA